MPYNAKLTLKYNAHINVEHCASIAAVKYIYKYIYKGHDRAQIRLEDDIDRQVVDEIKDYEDGRWFSAPEGAHRLLGFDLHGRLPSVQRVHIHLPGQENVSVDEDADLHEVARGLQAAGPPSTHLNAWFKFVQQQRQAYEAAADRDAEPPAALSTSYLNAPLVARWDAPKKQWLLRKNNLQFPQIGRIFSVDPTNQELYCLRTLLCRIEGAASFEELRTVRGELHPTFKAACAALGLLEDDGEWTRCMEEAVLVTMPKQIRLIFANLLAFNGLLDPVAMWEKFKEAMAEDFLHEARAENPDRTFDQHIFDAALRDIDRNLRMMGSRQCLAMYDLPTPAAEAVATMVQNEMAKYNAAAEAAKAEELLAVMNEEQRSCVNEVMTAVNAGVGKLIFLEGGGGCGKTFTYAATLHAVRGRGLMALPVASSGIAALLLAGGRTAHSRFKIPVPVLSDSVCFVGREEDTADMLRAARVIIWDEAVMAHKWCFEAVDRTLRDLMKQLDPTLGEMPFGGKVVLLGGDFRQILPVIKRGRRADIVQATVNKSSLWQHITVLHLEKNMRALSLLQAGDAAKAAEVQEFADFLLSAGDGTQPVDSEDKIRIPPCMCSKGQSIEELVDEIFSGLDECTTEEEIRDFMVSRAILAPLNEDVDKINAIANDRIKCQGANGQPASVQELLSVDTVLEQEQAAAYPTEFLNKLEFSGLPPHKLKIQEGAPVILLRNLSNGLANGTRLIIKKIHTTMLEAVVATGPLKHNTVFLPRLSITPSDKDTVPFTLRRRQFPVKPAFAMSINKAQGQTLKAVGIYLRTDVFGHGQLYVALSRSGSFDGIFVMVPGENPATIAVRGAKVKNVVYKDVLLPRRDRMQP